MRKFIDINELTTDNILTVSVKCEYEICSEYIGDDLGLQDAGCLEAFLTDAGVEFVDTDDKYYIYKLNDVAFRVPCERVEYKFEPGTYDSYLLFDKLEII